MNRDDDLPEPPASLDDRWNHVRGLGDESLEGSAGEDLASFLRAILDQLAPKVIRRLSYQFSGVLDFQDLEDAIAIALARLWDKRAEYDPEKSPLTSWFTFLAKNAAIEVLRKKARSRTRSANLAGVPAPSNDEPPLSGPVGLDLESILDTFSDVERLIILTKAHAEPGEDWAKQLAETLGKTPGAIRVQGLRLMEEVREEMKRRGHRVRERDAREGS